MFYQNVHTYNDCKLLFKYIFHPNIRLIYCYGRPTLKMRGMVNYGKPACQA